MKLALIGKSGAGKSSLFDLLRGERSFHNLPQTGRLTSIDLPDERLDELVKSLKPKKQRRIELNLIDPGAGFSASSQNIADAEQLTLILRENPEDFTQIVEAIFERDTQIVEKRLSGLEQELKKRHQEEALQREHQLFQNLLPSLRERKFLFQLSFSPQEQKVLSSYQLLSLKKLCLIFNSEQKKFPPALEEEMNKYQLPGYPLNIDLHYEIAQLPAQEREDYYREYNLDKKEVENLLKFLYNASGCIVFYTIVGDEIRAWSLSKGSSIIEAAGKIHTDMAKGFIRAEVISYQDFSSSGFSLPLAKEKGLLRLESREYILQDGEIIYIRFKV